jgi:hypothetical protein
VNIARVIDELRSNGLTEGIPDGHHVTRREGEWPIEGGLARIDPFGQDRYADERTSDDSEGDLDSLEDGPRDAETFPGEFLTGIDPNAELGDLPQVENFDLEIEKEGIDALAWYRSPHWEPAEAWGIYIRESALYSLANEVFASLSFSPHRHPGRAGRSITTLDRVRQAFRLLFLHEWVHFTTDVAAMALELGRPSPTPVYAPYMRQVYLQPSAFDEPIEEALANAFAYERLPGTKFRPALKAFFRKQPSGYRAFESVRGADFDLGRRRLATLLALGGRATSRSPLQVLIDPESRDLRFGNVPVRIVRDHDDPAFALGFVDSIPIAQQVETSQFRRDLKKLPKEIVDTYRDKTRRMMEGSLRVRGLNFEALKACDSVFSVRVTRAYRITLRQRNSHWELLRIGKHDEVYRKPGGC